MPKKLATAIYITEQQRRLLKELNRRFKVPVAQSILEGIDLVLERHSDLLLGRLDHKGIPSGVGLGFGSGAGDRADGSFNLGDNAKRRQAI